MKIRRKITRLPHYDYSKNGIYFVTFCTFHKETFLSSIELPKNDISKEAFLNLKPIGKICIEEAARLRLSFPDFKLISSVMMPNHIHALLWIDNDQGYARSSLSAYIKAWKSAVSRRAHQFDHTGSVWQKSFYDHIVRNEKDMIRIMQYIDENPQKWALDRFYTE